MNAFPVEDKTSTLPFPFWVYSRHAVPENAADFRFVVGCGVVDGKGSRVVYTDNRPIENLVASKLDHASKGS